MSIIISNRKALAIERRKNEILQAQVAEQKEIIAFIGLIAADIDIDDLVGGDEQTQEEEVVENG